MSIIGTRPPLISEEALQGRCGEALKMKKESHQAFLRL